MTGRVKTDVPGLYKDGEGVVVNMNRGEYLELRSKRIAKLEMDALRQEVAALRDEVRRLSDQISGARK